jgi:hypothetical protein
MKFEDQYDITGKLFLPPGFDWKFYQTSTFGSYAKVCNVTSVPYVTDTNAFSKRRL